MGMQTEVTDNGKEGDRIMKSKYTNYQAEHPRVTQCICKLPYTPQKLKVFLLLMH